MSCFDWCFFSPRFSGDLAFSLSSVVELCSYFRSDLFVVRAGQFNIALVF